MSRWLWFLSGLSTRLWLRASIYSAIAVITALISIYFGHLLPEETSREIGADAVDGILNILASSMLAVTIFSVSTMVSSYSAATNNLTPRATRLLIEDKISQNALSTFIGTFIYSIVGIIALKAGVYGSSGRLVLFLVTIAVIVVIIITLLRWIEYLSRLGRVSETVQRVEETVTDAFEERLRNPYLGGTPLLSSDSSPKSGIEIFSDEIGYIQHIDMGFLSEIAKDHEGQIYVQAMPGKFIDDSIPLAIAEGIHNDKAIKEIHKAFVMGRERSFRQDPRYGMAVLSEIAIRALSPAINDPGTAIHIITVGVRILSLWSKRKDYVDKDTEIKFPRIHVVGLKIDDLFEDFFSPIARDGAGFLEVATRLQKAFISLNRTNDTDLKRVCAYYSAISLKRSLSALSIEEDKSALKHTANLLAI